MNIKKNKKQEKTSEQAAHTGTRPALLHLLADSLFPPADTTNALNNGKKNYH